MTNHAVTSGLHIRRRYQQVRQSAVIRSTQPICYFIFLLLTFQLNSLLYISIIFIFILCSPFKSPLVSSPSLCLSLCFLFCLLFLSVPKLFFHPLHHHFKISCAFLASSFPHFELSYSLSTISFFLLAFFSPLSPFSLFSFSLE
jgi:hypothetical protein